MTAAADHTWQALWARARQSSSGTPLHLYALLDAAQDKSLLARLPGPAGRAAGLFGFARDSKEGAASPWLVRLGSDREEPAGAPKALLLYLLEQVRTVPCATLLASSCDFDGTLAHLRRAADVQLAGGKSMYLAFWDPAILGTLLGQADAQAGEEVEAVLDDRQRLDLLGPVQRWWFWDRAGQLHEHARQGGAQPAPVALPLQLRRSQEERLVEAAVPDLLVYYIRLNQPQLRDKLPPLSLHWFVRQQMHFARGYGLAGTRDLLNYVCVALMAGARFDRTDAMRPLLARVRAGRLRWDEAMEQVDGALLESQSEAPRVLLDDRGRPVLPRNLPAVS